MARRVFLAAAAGLVCLGEPAEAAWRTVAGTGRSGFGGDTFRSMLHGFAVETRLNTPWGLALDPGHDRLYFSDSANGVVRSVDLRTGLAEVVAGSEFVGFAGDGGLAVLAELNTPTGLALDATRQVLYVSDTSNHRVRKIGLDNGRVYQAEVNTSLPPADFGMTAQVSLHEVDTFTGCPDLADANTPYGTGPLFQGSKFCRGSTGVGFAIYKDLIRERIDFHVLAPSGPALYELRFRYADRYDNVHAGGGRRLRLLVNGVVQTSLLAFPPSGRSQAGSRSEFRWVSHSATLPFSSPQRNVVSLELAGFGGPLVDLLYVVPPRLPIDTVAGTGEAGPTGCRHGCLDLFPSEWLALSSPVDQPLGLALDSAKQLLYIADSGNGRVLRLELATGLASTVVGGARRSSTRDGEEGSALYGKLFHPEGLLLDSAGRYLYISDSVDNRVRRVDLQQPAPKRTILTVAGFGRGNAPFEYLLRRPCGLALDEVAGVLYIADHDHGRVRHISINPGSCPLDVVSRLQCAYETVAEPECVAQVGCCWNPNCLDGFNPDGRGPAHQPEDVLTMADQKSADPPISFVRRGSGFCCHPDLRAAGTLDLLEGPTGLAWDARDNSLLAAQAEGHRVVKLRVADSLCASDSDHC